MSFNFTKIFLQRKAIVSRGPCILRVHNKLWILDQEVFSHKACENAYQGCFSIISAKTSVSTSGFILMSSSSENASVQLTQKSTASPRSKIFSKYLIASPILPASTNLRIKFRAGIRRCEEKPVHVSAIAVNRFVSRHRIPNRLVRLRRKSQDESPSGSNPRFKNFNNLENGFLSFTDLPNVRIRDGKETLWRGANNTPR